MTRTGKVMRSGGRALLVAGLAGLAGSVLASSLNEADVGDFSNDRLLPTAWLLSNSEGGFNIITGTTGGGAGGVDRDYVHFTVPTGYVLSQWLVGQVTTVGGNGSFLGLAEGSELGIDPATARNAAGLLGYRIYGVADRGQDILGEMAKPFNGSSGFNVPLPSGAYTFWVQELSTAGPFTYRFNLVLAPAVPEPATVSMLLAGAALLGWRRQRSSRTA
jgi:PEP-CTERM motif